MNTTFLDISNAINKVWQKGLPHKISSYGLSGRVFSIITGMSQKVVINVQFTGALEVNAGVCQWPMLGPNYFLIFINDLCKNILNSFVNIYSSDMNIYVRTYKTLNGQTMATDLSSDHAKA